VHTLLKTSLVRSLAEIPDAQVCDAVAASRHQRHSQRGAFATIHEHVVADAVDDRQAVVRAGDLASFDAQIAHIESLAREALLRRATCA
jgi:two-component system capsular synthesis sensor histidine kinase RcsC